MYCIYCHTQGIHVTRWRMSECQATLRGKVIQVWLRNGMNTLIILCERPMRLERNERTYKQTVKYEVLNALFTTMEIMDGNNSKE